MASKRRAVKLIETRAKDKLSVKEIMIKSNSEKAQVYDVKAESEFDGKIVVTVQSNENEELEMRESMKLCGSGL